MYHSNSYSWNYKIYWKFFYIKEEENNKKLTENKWYSVEYKVFCKTIFFDFFVKVWRVEKNDFFRL